MKAILLTGYSSGLGKAIHDRLISSFSEFRLIFIGRTDVLTSHDNGLVYLKIDLESLSIENLSNFDECLQGISELILINNAGVISPITSHKECDIGRFKRAVNINFMSPVILINKILQLVRKVQVINISTGATDTPIPFWGGYCSTKAAMAMFLNVLALEDNLDVINYDPGVMETKMQSKIRQSAKVYCELKGFDTLHKNGELQAPSQVAKKICDLIK